MADVRVKPGEDADATWYLGSDYLFISWYKQRGATDSLWLLGEASPRAPTEGELLFILAHYEAQREQRLRSMPPAFAPLSTSDLDAKLHTLLAAGRFLGAIKAYRNATGSGITEAKNYCLKLDPTQRGFRPA